MDVTGNKDRVEVITSVQCRRRWSKKCDRLATRVLSSGTLWKVRLSRTRHFLHLAAATTGLMLVFCQSPMAGEVQVLPAAPTCRTSDAAPACSAPHGDRSAGWARQSRSEVMARHGMVATSQPLAAQAGLQVLARGGNAIDAAVAAAAVLNVVEPMMTGLAGDLFMIVYSAKDGKLHALNASGMAPSGATIAHYNQLGYRVDSANPGPGSGMPKTGVLTVTVPGALWGWNEALKKFGTWSLKQALQPATQYAEEGFPVSERIAQDWMLPDAGPLEKCCTEMDSDSVRTWYINGRPPRAGEIYRNPELAKTFRILQERGVEAFYGGDIGKALVSKIRSLGGTMTVEDLAAYRGTWVDPVETTYHGRRIAELPPPSQAWSALLMLNILEVCVPEWSGGASLADLGPRSPKYWHFLIEAKKLAYAELIAHNADPDVVPVPVQHLLAKSYAASLCGNVNPNHAAPVKPIARADQSGDTIALTTADAEGNMVAWINSNNGVFGSGITVPGYGFVLHNRGSMFSLDPHSPNAIAPHKRPFNTLSAGFIMNGDVPMMSVLLMGGDMQAQGHAQIIVDVLDLGANLQMASDIARFRHSQVQNELVMESELFNLVGSDLQAMGHAVSASDGNLMGGFQSIARVPIPGGFYYRGGSDHRKDGLAVGW